MENGSSEILRRKFSLSRITDFDVSRRRNIALNGISIGKCYHVIRYLTLIARIEFLARCLFEKAG